MVFMLIGQTNGKASSEYKFTFAFTIIGVILILAEVACHFFTGNSLGVNIQNVFYAITGLGGGYQIARTVTKSRAITGLMNQDKINAELSMSRNYSSQNSLESEFSPTDAYSDSDYYYEEPRNLDDTQGYDIDEDTTKIPSNRR